MKLVKMKLFHSCFFLTEMYRKQVPVKEKILLQFTIQKKFYNKLVILCTYTCPCTVHIHIMVDDFFVISDERNCLRTTLMDIELCNNLNSNTLQCVSPLIMSEVYRIWCLYWKTPYLVASKCNKNVLTGYI